jgi:hypothetical protein
MSVGEIFLIQFSMVHSRKTTNAQRGVDYTISIASKLDRVDCQRHASASLPTATIRYPFYRRRTGSQDRPDGSENLVLLEIRSAAPPSRSQSLYLLSCLFKLIRFIQMLRAVK